MGMSVRYARNRRIDSGLDPEWPLIGIAVLVPVLEPCWSTRASGSQAKPVVDPVGVTVEVLYSVERSSQGHQRQGLARSFVDGQAVVAREQILGGFEQVVKEKIEIGITLEIAAEV